MWLIQHFCIFPVSNIFHMVGIGIDPYRRHVSDRFPTLLAIITICWKRSSYMSHIWIHRGHIWSSDELPSITLYLIEILTINTDFLFLSKKGPSLSKVWYFHAFLASYYFCIKRYKGRKSANWWSYLIPELNIHTTGICTVTQLVCKRFGPITEYLCSTMINRYWPILAPCILCS